MRYWVSRGGLWACALLIALGPSCTSVVRKPRTALGASAAYSGAEDVGFSCDDEPPSQRHTQVGGTVELSRFSEQSDYQSGRVTVLTGSLDESANVSVDPSRSPYWITGLSGTAGWDFDHFGHELGGGFLFVPQAAGGNDNWISPSLYYRLRAGLFDGPALEAQLGSRQMFLFDTRLFSAGLRLGQPWIELHMGVAAGGRLMVNQGRDEPPFLLGTRGNLDAMFYADGEVEVAPRWRIAFGVQLGRQLPTATLGASYDL
jgi:hypothetical protein